MSFKQFSLDQSATKKAASAAKPADAPAGDQPVSPEKAPAEALPPSKP